MNRIATVLVTTATAAAVLSGCSGDSPYCSAVKDHQTALDSFGKKPSDKAYATYSKAVHAIRQDAPTSIKPDWVTLDRAISGVLKAQKKAGIALEDMTDTEKVKQLSSDDLTTLNTAYSAFGKTETQRKAIVADIKTECKVTLK